MAHATPNPGDLVEAAIAYADAGIKVVQLHSVADDGHCTCGRGNNCPQGSRGKHPRGNNWQRSATADSDKVISRWEKYPTANVGVLLGPESGLIDVEYDTEEGRRTAERVLGECYTATYRSARSTHRWFRWNERLPNVQKLELKGLEIRIGGDGKGAQSVAPPSVHHTGRIYEWIPTLSFAEAGIAEVPPELTAFIAENWIQQINTFADDSANPDGRGREYWESVLAGVADGRRNDTLASVTGKLLAGLRDLDDEALVALQLQAARSWNQLNDPPLGDAEVVATFKSILTRERRKRMNESAMLPPAPRSAASVAQDAVPPAGDAPPPARPVTGGENGWRLTIVDSDPPVYRLYSPYWAERTPRGFIVLTADEMLSVAKLKRAVLVQTKFALPRNFRRVWEGAGTAIGLMNRLLLDYDQIDADGEQRRELVVAGAFYDRVIEAVVEPKPDYRGRPSRIVGEGIYYSFSTIWEQLNASANKVTRGELGDLEERIGVESPRKVIDGRKLRLRLLTGRAEAALENYLRLNEPSPD